MTATRECRAEGDGKESQESGEETGGVVMQHKYTAEEKTFFWSYVPGHTYKEIQEEFQRVFEWDITVEQVKGFMGRNKLNNGLTGRFRKGHIPYNKGKKGYHEGYHAPGSEKTWFQKGHIPQKHRPVGSERISRDGYIEVKVAEPKEWREKHRVVWEKENGPIPKGKCIIFLNGKKTDVRIENLLMIDKKINIRLNKDKMRYEDPEATKAAVNVARLSEKIREIKRKKK